MNITTYTDELSGLLSKLDNPSYYSSREYPKTAKRIAELEEVIDTFDRLQKINIGITEAKELAHGKDAELAELAELELAESTEKKASLEAKLEELLIPKDPNADKDCIVEIRAGAGGDEASLFAGELYRMYTRHAESAGHKLELMSDSPSEVGGYKEISFAIRGDSAYGSYKLEAGVHRVQRVPDTESQGRVHTSTVTVAVLPEAEDTDIEIKDADIRVDTYRAGGHGGQSVNTTDSAIRITHIPTGLDSHIVDLASLGFSFLL